MVWERVALGAAMGQQTGRATARSWRGAFVAALVSSLLLAGPAAQALPNSRPDASVDPNAPVLATAVSGNVIYIGGGFTSVAGQPRNHAAAIDASTGALLPFNPNVNGPVRAIAVADGKVYLGGTFKTVRGVARKNIAAVNPTTGAPLAWSANVGSTVRSVVSAGGKVFIGGTFRAVNSQSRPHVAALASSNGALLTWRAQIDQPSGTCGPRCPPTVNAMAVGDGGASLYIGGAFGVVQGANRNSGAKLTTSSAGLLAWNPNVYHATATQGSKNTVLGLVLGGSKAFVCGDFYRVGGKTARNLAATNPTTGGRISTWQAATDGAVNTCTGQGSTLYLGGHFDYVGKTQDTTTTRRQHLAAVSMGDGAVLNWNPGANSVQGVYALDATSSKLSVGGYFSHIGGVAQPYFAKFSGSI